MFSAASVTASLPKHLLLVLKLEALQLNQIGSRIKEKDCTTDSESNEASICHPNNYASILTTPNHDKSPGVNKDMDPTNSMHKQHTEDRNGASKGSKASNSSGTASLIPNRLADFMLPPRRSQVDLYQSTKFRQKL